MTAQDALASPRPAKLTVEDFLLLDRSGAFDDYAKAELIYAAADIPEYWVVDVKARLIHQMWAPGGKAYGERREAVLGQRVRAVTIERLDVETGGI